MNRALSALGLARRAGKLNWGFDTAVEAMRSGACGVVILAADLSDKTKKNVRFEAEKYHVSVLEPAFTMEEISAAIGKKAGTKFSGKADILGGVILILIGIEIFVSRLF